IQAPGGVERLSVAVWIDADLTAAETRRVQELVAAALGVDSTRGDTVIVDSMPFASAPALPVLAPEAAPAPAVPLWLIAVAAAVVLLMVVLATRRRPAPAPVAPALDLTMGPEEPPAPILSAEEKAKHRLRERIAGLIEENPREAAPLVTVWLAED